MLSLNSSQFLSGLISLRLSLLMPISKFTCFGRWKVSQSSPTLHELIGPRFPETVAKSNITFLGDDDRLVS